MIKSNERLTDWVKQAVLIEEMNRVGQFVSTLTANEIGAKCLPKFIIDEMTENI